MNINQYESDNILLGFDDLVFYLSQIVLSKSDKEISESHKRYVDSDEKLKEAQLNLKRSRAKLIETIQENERIQTLLEVVKLIDTLRKEGPLLGGDRMKMLNLLGKVKDKDLKSLKALKNNLTVNIPVSTGRTMIS